jgi:hypothetical protein
MAPALSVDWNPPWRYEQSSTLGGIPVAVHWDREIGAMPGVRVV